MCNNCSVNKAKAQKNKQLKHTSRNDAMMNSNKNADWMAIFKKRCRLLCKWIEFDEGRNNGFIFFMNNWDWYEKPSFPSLSLHSLSRPSFFLSFECRIFSKTKCGFCHRFIWNFHIHFAISVSSSEKTPKNTASSRHLLYSKKFFHCFRCIWWRGWYCFCSWHLRAHHSPSVKLQRPLLIFVCLFFPVLGTVCWCVFYLLLNQRPK